MSTLTIDELDAMKTPVLIGMNGRTRGAALNLRYRPPEDSRFEHRLMRLVSVILVLKRSDIF